MFKITKEFKFEMAHKLSKSYTCKCQHIHGHSYRALVSFYSKYLNDEEVVVDFTRVKEEISYFIDKLDHNLVIHKDDESAPRLIEGAEAGEYPIIVTPLNPTAEYIAGLLYEVVQTQMTFLEKACGGLLIEGVEVQVFETATSSAKIEGLTRGERLPLEFSPLSILSIDNTKGSKNEKN